jgi:hypothetical protein
VHDRVGDQDSAEIVGENRKRLPTEEEWEEFLGHFERRKVSLGTCGRSYATP